MSSGHQLRFVSSVAAVLAGLPLLVYSGARLLGLLPSPESWAASGGNPHGPWHASIVGWAFLLSVSAVGLLALGALLVGVPIAIRARSVGVLVFSGAVSAIAAAALLWYVRAFLWVVR